MKRNQCFFSIIIPVYNVKDYLEECVNSVLNQTYHNYEIILIDDGSTDGSETICDNFFKTNLNIKVIHKKNEGPAIARNIGLKEAKGNYIIFLDSDDILINNAIEKCNNLILKDDSDVFLGQNFKILFPGGTMENRVTNTKISEVDTDILVNIIKHSPQSITYVWKNIYKTDFIKKNKIYFMPNVLCGEDIDWNTEILLKAKKVKFFDFYTHIYRGNRKGSIVTECSYNRVNDFYKIVDKWIKYSDKIQNNELAICLKNFYSKGFYSNLKYIYEFKEKESLIAKIKDGDFWRYPVTINNKIILIFKNIFGIEFVLKYLNFLYRGKITLKKFLIKLKIIDR